MRGELATRLQFAVVREDPRIEEQIIRDLRPDRVLLVASGGCTALHLRACFPDLDVTLIDPNPEQRAHIARKLAALPELHRRPELFNVGTDDPRGLHECGNFERIFRVFRAVLDLWVLPAEDRARQCADAAASWDDVIAHPYWPVAFATALSDPMLLATFGPAAVQHAPRGSYPAYFQRRIESGLLAPDRARNPWLHHVLLGRYLADPAAWPPFLRDPPRDTGPFTTLACDFAQAPSFAPFAFVDLSNVPDWMDDDACDALIGRLGAELRPGAAVLWRQLNDPRPLARRFAPAFQFDPALDARLARDERSLFYDEVHLARRI